MTNIYHLCWEYRKYIGRWGPELYTLSAAITFFQTLHTFPINRIDNIFYGIGVLVVALFLGIISYPIIRFPFWLLFGLRFVKKQISE